MNKTMKNWLLSLCFFAPITGRSQTPSSIVHDGLTREFIYYTPSNWNAAQPMPLMLVLHGLTQTGPGVMNITQFNQLAEQHGFVVVYPDGINNAWNANMNLPVSSANDLGFIETLAQYFQNNFGTDPLRQYLVGFSNGGFMSHKIACESSMCFAGIATISGNMSDTTAANCNPSFHPAVLHIHGTADAVVPYNGGAATGISVDETMNKWKSFLSCDAVPNTVNMPNTNAFDLSFPQRISYLNGLNELELIKITGGGHQWPGISTLIGGAGTINMDFYAPEIIWAFLSGKTCPTTSQLTEFPASDFLIYPNPAGSMVYLNCEMPAIFTIYGIDGRSIQSGVYEQGILLNDLESGHYFLRIQDSFGKSKAKSFVHLKE
jgi:polyhydroxybutyrate depolymerase